MAARASTTRPRPRLHGRMTRRLRLPLFVPVLAALLAVSLAGCTGGSGTGSSSSPDIGVPAPAPAVGVPDGTDEGRAIDEPSSAGGSGGVGGSGEMGGSEAGVVDRDVVTAGTVTLTVDDPAAAAREATGIVEAAGGRVEARTEQAGTARSDGTAVDAGPATDGGRATLTVRIPSSVFSTALDELQGLGRVDSVSLTATDVTARGEDLDARIRGVQTSVDRLLELLAASGDTEALLKVEKALADRQTELERLQAERARLADAVALTTVTLQLLSAGIAPDPEPEDFWSGLLAGVSSLVGALGATAVGLGVALPWLLFLAAVAAVVLVVARRIVHRRASRDARATEDPGPIGGPGEAG